jgi:hypothetical protein
MNDDLQATVTVLALLSPAIWGYAGKSIRSSAWGRTERIVPEF